MLGGLLSQAEEEERQREAEHAVQQQVAAAASHSLAGSSSSPSKQQYGSHEGEEERRYADEGEYDDEDDHSGDLEEYSYDDEDDDSRSHSDNDDESTHDGESDGSSADYNEESELLHSQGRRRRRKRKQPASNWKRTLSRWGSKISSAVVAIADVDNVWDSPDAAANYHYPAGGAYHAEGPENLSANANTNNANGNGNQQQPTRSTIIYNVITGGTSTRNHTAAIFWFIFLVTSYASERSTFKLLVDRVGPFRLFSAELILGAHAVFTGLGMLMGSLFWRKKVNKEIVEIFPEGGGGFGSGLPLADIGLMAVLDTVYLLLGIISGAHVPPVLTVILVQTTIPLTACFTQCVHPDGFCSGGGASTANEELSPGGNSSTMHSHSNVQIISSSTLNEMQSMNDMSYPDISSIPNLPAPTPPPVKGWGGLSRYHIIGTGLMFVAIFLGLTPAVLSLDDIILTRKDAMPARTAYNTIVFCLAAIPAAMSQLYKEHTLTRLRQPIDRNTLNMVLSIFQLLFAIVVSPLAYGLQGMGDGPGWTSLYPSKGIGENFSHGLSCFIGTLDEETMKNGYPEIAECRWAWALVLMHVLSIIMVGVAIDKLAAATKVMYRGVSVGIMVAVILMFIYQIRDQWCEYGPLVSFFHLTATAVLIVGAEIYHRVSLVDASFETVYPEIGDLYDEEE